MPVAPSFSVIAFTLGALLFAVGLCVVMDRIFPRKERRGFPIDPVEKKKEDSP